MTTEDLVSFVNAAVGVHALALLVVNLTPTPKDNEAMGELQSQVVKIYRAIELIAGIVTKKAKQ